MKRTAAAALGGKTLAQKIGAVLRKAPPGMTKALSADLRAHVAEMRAQRNGVDGVDNRDDLEDFFHHVAGMAAIQGVLGALAGIGEIDKINRVIADADDEYKPGGPPISPVHDSFFMTWSVVDSVFGRKRETVARVVLQLADVLELDDEVRAAIERMASSRLGLYRVRGVTPPHVGRASILTVDELVTGRRLRVQFIEAFDIRAAELVLMRPLEPRPASAHARQITHLVVDTPYTLLGHSDPEWTDYLARQAAESKRRLDTAAYEQIMHSRDRPRRWLEFIVDGYAGTRRHNAVLVAGIPDRPETLHHHRDHRPEERYAIPPGTPDQERATILSSRLAQYFGTLIDRQPAAYHQALKAQFEALIRRGGAADLWHQLIAPVLLYHAGPSGQPPLVTMLEAGEVDADARELIDGYLQGVTSAFEVMDVDPGERMRVRDLLTAREFDVRERAGTMQMPTRALILARLVEYRGIWMIDGWFPQPGRPRIRDTLVASLHQRLASVDSVSVHPLATGDAVFGAMLVWQEVLQSNEQRGAQAPRPKLITTSGDPIAPTKITLRFDPTHHRDVTDAIHRLRGAELEFEPEDSTTHFVVLDRRNTLEAKLAVDPGVLEIEANASARAQRVLQRLRRKLPGILRTISTTTTPVEDLLASPTPGTRR